LDPIADRSLDELTEPDSDWQHLLLSSIASTVDPFD
jgi:hypothetical protein